MKVADTFRLMAKIAKDQKKIVLTKKTRDEFLEESGVDLEGVAGVKIANPPEKEPPDAKNHILCCMTLDEGEELVLPDNLIGKCAWGCERTIQYRPNVPKWITKVCLYCAAERPTDNHA